MKLIINNNNIIIKADKIFLPPIEQLFTFLDHSYCFVGGKFDKTRIYKKKLLKIINDVAYLPIGFKQDLLNYLDKNNIQFDIQDNRIVKTTNFDFTDNEIKSNLYYLELYDYQIDTVKSCITNINGICQLPTSAGKTEIFLSLCNLLKLKTLILFKRIDLAHQTLKRAKNAKLDSGIVQGNNIDENHLIVMATVQSVHKLQNKYDMVISDECHNASANQYQNILKINDFIYRFGFSATPFTKDEYKNAKIKQYIGDIIYKLKADYLIENNKIAEPIIKIFPINKPDNIFKKPWDYAEWYGIIENDYRNNKIAELINNITGQCLILVKKIKHGKILQNLIPDSYFLYGNSEIENRKDIIADFENKKIKCIIASTIFDEGISINIIQNLIIAGGGSSQIKTIQRLGRGLRISKNKNTVNVFDFLDKQNYITERHSKIRIKFYKHEGFNNIELIND
jgi:superfamily II DNA or RNA helicase